MVDQVNKQSQISIKDMQYPQCLKHSKHQCESFSIDLTHSTNLQCIKCIVQNKSSPTSLVVISDIYHCNNSKIVQNWPPLLNQEQILNQVYEISKHQSNSMQNKHKITSFFDEFQRDICETIQKIKKDLLIRTDSLIDTHQNVLQTYHQIAEINKLKGLISPNDQKSSTLNQNLKQFTQQKIDQKERNTDILRDVLSQFENQQLLMNFDQPRIIKERILNQISKINFFLMEDQQQLVYLQTNILNQNGIRQNPMQNRSQQIFKLISNKSNYCSDIFLKEIETCLNKIEPILNSLIECDSIHLQNRQSIDFGKYSLEQLDNINALVKITSQINSEYQQINDYDNKLISNQIQQESNFILDNLNFTNKNQQLKKMISKLLRKYPIFETLDISILNNIHFNIIKTDFSDTQTNSTVTKNEKDQIYFQRVNSTQWISGYIGTPISNKLKYIVRLELDCKSDLQHYFWAGLLNIGTLNTLWYDTKNIIFSSYTKYNQKILKGKGLWDGSVRNGIQQVEIRFCVEQNIFICQDYPNYENITTIKEDILFNNNESYYFGMQLFHQNNRITVTNFDIVDEFPDINR